MALFGDNDFRLVFQRRVVGFVITFPVNHRNDVCVLSGEFITAYRAIYAQAAQAINADIAYWFKVNPLTLSETEKLGLIANLPRVQAQDRIQRGDYSETDFKGVYQLFLLAYGDEDLAQKKQTEAAKAFLEQQSKRGKNYG